MKKLTALLMALLMVATMMTTAMADTTVSTAPAYTPLTPTAVPTISHTMTLTKTELETIPYDITYRFTVGNPVVIQPAGITDATKVAKFVTGKPVIADLEYEIGDTFDANKSRVETLQFSWGTGDDAVKFYEPGIYRWEITKSLITEAPDVLDPNDPAPSNNTTKFYLHVLVTSTDNGLKAEKVFVTANDTLTNKIDQNDSLADQYPAKLVSLTIKKEVTGTQASKNQYFPFEVNLKSPAGAATMSYDITGVANPVPETAYNASVDNTTRVTVDSTSATGTTFTLWLRHGDVAVIDGMLYGTTYTITEDPGDYEASIIVSGDTDDKQSISGDEENVDKGDITVSDKLNSNEIVTYTNEKNATVPTGIDLQTSAPIFGLLMAMAMMFMAFAGKRKEQMN